MGCVGMMGGSGPETVYINDDAINVALEGNEITFVIPYHASGGEAEFVTAMINGLGENIDRDYVYDYTLVQGDHIDPNSTDEQIRLRKIRKALLMRNVEIKDNDGKVIVKGKKDSLKITEDDLALIQGNKFLSKMLERMYGINYNFESVAQEERYKGVSFDSKTAEQIFPWEYWDVSTTIETAYINGDLFQEYCESLGVIPRFSGMTSNGDKMSYGDFTKSKGYWKLLIDRRMYDRSGKYRDQQAVTATFNAEFFDQQVQAGRFAATNAIVNDNIIDKTVADFVTNSNQLMANFSERVYRNNADKYKALLSLHTNPKPIQNSIGSIDDIINQLIEENGEVERGAVVSEDQRNVPLPKSVDGKTVTPKWNRTALESSAVNEETVEFRKEEIIRDSVGYIKSSNKHTLAAAQQELDNIGYDKAVARIFSIYQNDIMPEPQHIALAELLIVEAGKRGEHVVASALIRDTAFMATKLGQAVQALSLIKKLPTQHQLDLINKTAREINKGITNSLKKKIAGKNADEIKRVENEIEEIQNQIQKSQQSKESINPDDLSKKVSDLVKLQHILKRLKGEVSLSPETEAEIVSAKTKEETENAINKAIKEISSQIPATNKEKFNAFRYTAMLSNLTTHARNMLGNVVMFAVTNVKTIVEGLYEQIGVENKTVSVSGLYSPRYWSAANKIRKSEKVQVFLKGNRYMESEVMEGRVIFNTKILEKWRKTVGNALEVEDTWFKVLYFNQYLASWMKAQGINPETVTQEDIPENVIKTAIREAKRGTYQEESKFANTLNELEKKNFAWQVAIGGTIPFKRTPINIFKQGVRYSPIGLVKGLYDLATFKNNEISANEIVNELAMGTTGIGLMALGWWLFSCGALQLDLGDEPEDKYEKLTGGQGFSIVIGDTSFTIDWLSPSAMPLFVGAAICEMFEEEDFNLETVYDSFLQIANPMFEMSMMQGVQNILESARYGENPIGSVAQELFSGYFSQAAPTFASRFSKIIDPTSRNVSGGYLDFVPDFVEEFALKYLTLFPGVSLFLAPKVDAWGREITSNDTEEKILNATEQMVSPAYFSTTKKTDMEKELERLYQSQGKPSVFPQTITEINKGGEKYKLSPYEQADFNKLRGQLSFDILTSFVASEEYNKLSDRKKVDVVVDMYEFANDVAEAEYFKANEIEFEKSKMLSAYEMGIDPIKYYLISRVSGYDNTRKAMQKYGLSSDEKTIVWDVIYPYAAEYWNGRKKPKYDRKEKTESETDEWDIILGG